MPYEQQGKSRAQRQDPEAAYSEFQRRKLTLDLTRGKPGAEQLDLSNGLDGALSGNYSLDGTDVRNYGGLDGLPSAKALGAGLLGVAPDQVLVGGNSSLNLMYFCVLSAWLRGLSDRPPWSAVAGGVSFLCPVPGYDRHFTITESLGIRMVNVPMSDTGPDMDRVEQLLASDPSIRGIWCVPRHSNPSGAIYSDATVQRLAMLGRTAAVDFRIFWDNAYAVHDFRPCPALAPLLELSQAQGTEDNVLVFGSTSKISWAGAGLGFMAASQANRRDFLDYLGTFNVGPDKVNMARHLAFFKDMEGIRRHMAAHAEIVRPKFDLILDKLGPLGEEGLGTWTEPRGGYFVSFDSRFGHAREIVALAAELGVKLTPAGAPFPYGKDPENSNIRIAPTYLSLDALADALDGFVLCVRLAAARAG